MSRGAPDAGAQDGIALTFDDGPDPEWTPRLLDLLAERSVRATFFVIGRRAKAAPGVLGRMRADGHTIALHCDEHVRHTERDRGWLEDDTDRALCALAGQGVRAELWRTPWGVRAPFTAEVAAARGLTLMGWTADTHDWRGDNAETMFAATRAALVPGAVVLAHDGIGPGALRTDPRETLRYVTRVTAHARAAGVPLIRLAS